MSSPPGYVRAGSEGESVPGIRPVTLLAAQVVLTTALLVAAARELLLRAPPLYLAPLDLGMSARFWGLALGLGLGALAARRWHARAAAAIWSLAAIGV
ncbi:MAG TPA: hypothetical protein VM686_31005, partial [Polyangiaceae bacterium]|nr:hypothetical protein [Polyangiaceae bacterium]